MYDHERKAQPLFDLAVGLARTLAPSVATPRTIEVGPFPLPLTTEQMNACAGFWKRAQERGIACTHIKNDTAQTVRVVVYLEGR